MQPERSSNANNKSMEKYVKGKMKASDTKKAVDAMKANLKNKLKNHLVYGIFSEKNKKRVQSPTK